jgi:murein DD-endopeptidase MepM/ murein hydrolase activator NlpD
VRQTYHEGRDGMIHVLLNSRSMHDYMSRSYYVERVVDADLRLIVAIEADERSLQADRLRVRRQQAESRALQAALDADRKEYRADVDRKRDLLHDVRTERIGLQEALDVLEAASRDITARIRALQRTPGGRARMLRAWTGRFVRPVAGPVTSSFGMRLHPILRRRRMHNGVDFGARYGETIRAAAGGEVVMASYMRGYGNTVVLDHGGGVTTLYAHCSALLVSEGHVVAQGRPIARVGTTGLSTGPHLHFEVRQNGTPVNPR